MKKNKDKRIEEKLDGMEFLKLTDSERDYVWRSIAENIGGKKPALSPYLPWLLAKKTTMIPLLIGALMFVGVGGSVAADSARPGDALFGLDRAVESVRIAMAGNGKAELKVKFAQERLAEVRSLVAEARSVSATSTATSTSATSTNSTTTPNAKASRDNVALGVSTAIAFLNDISADLSASSTAAVRAELEAVIDQLETVVNAEDVKFRLKQNGDFQLMIKGNVRASSTVTSTGTSSGSAKIKINTSGNKERIEVREDDGRIKIELKNGELFKFQSKTEIEVEDGDEDEDDDDNATSTERRSGKGKGLLRNLIDNDDDENDDD